MLVVLFCTLYQQRVRAVHVFQKERMKKLDPARRSTLAPPSFKAAKTSTSVSGVTVADRTEKWKAALNALGAETREGKHCPDIGNTSSSSIYAVDRIGSDSAFGQVFKIGFRDYPGVFSALKIMPHLTYQTRQANAREIETMLRLSDLVTSGATHYFPIVYGSGTCPDIKMSPPTDEQRQEDARTVELYVRANNWKLVNAMIQAHVPAAKHRAAGIMFWNWDPYSVADHLNAIIEGIDPIMGNLTAPVVGEIVFMELAWGDLEKYIDLKEDARVSKGHSFMGDAKVPQGWKSNLSLLVRNVIRAIVDLQTLANTVHGDLHLGNVLIQMIRTADGRIQPVPLLSDFGHTRPLNPSKLGDAVFDLEYFMRSLGAKRLKLPVELRAKVDTFNKITISTRSFRSMNAAIDFWDKSFFDVSTKMDTETNEKTLWSQFLT